MIPGVVNGVSTIMIKQNNRRHLAGFAMLEALVSIAIMAFGILGLIALQAQMTKASSESRYRAQASFLADQLISQMWLDQTSLATKWAVANGKCNQTSNAVCTAWTTAVTNALPSGSATVSFSSNQATVTVTWQMPGDVAHQFQTQATINN